MARKLEGVTRNAGKHAGGVVIAPTKITDFAPLYCDAEGHHPVTQFDKNDVEYAGLVKFDFLGLRTLTIIDWALEMINARRAKTGLEPIDIAAIPLDDKKSFDMLQRSETTAVFQLESRGMKDLIKRLKPDCFEDMIALVALFRPGRCSRAWWITSSTANTAAKRSPTRTFSGSMSRSSRCWNRPTASSCIRNR